MANTACNESGWIKQEEFIKYANPSRDKLAVLLLDNHTLYLSIEAIDLAIDNGIVMLTFPPHCLHCMPSQGILQHKMHWLAEIQCWKSAAYSAHSRTHVQGVGSWPNTQEHKI